ncbi:MAG TPA: MlaD family protein, partial [Candidatus Binataceae bacterium]|nr:MlaD family protein [Candidatus Binataceae bacterium]
MYASWTTKLIVGLFALAGIVALGILSLRLGKIELFNNKGYVIYANFDNISGLKTGDQVEIAGVQVGKVISISLKDYRASVGLRINDGVHVDTEAIASIKTSGIIGDKYV